MSIEINRISGGCASHPVNPDDLMLLLADFKKRADPDDVDGWTVRDIARVMMNTATHIRDATWLAFDAGQLVGFLIVVFGPSIQTDRIEGQIVGMYVLPGEPLIVAQRMIAAMKEYAKQVGAFRLVFGSQRRAANAFRRLGGAHPVCTLYAIPLEEKDECLSLYQS